jgi:hypothetical protein
VEDNQLSQADVLGLVLKGAWTPEQAEAWADRVGGPPFAQKPDASYDPSKAANWSLPMSLVWIVSRDFNGVREVWRKWREAHVTWRLNEVGGWSLERPPPQPDETCVYRRYSDAAGAAVESLWRELETGAIKATGINKSEGIRRVISPLEWCDLTVGGSHPVAAFVLEGAYHGQERMWEEAFAKVLLPVEQVLRAFPPGAGAASEIGPTEDEVRALIVKAKDENGGFISQENGAIAVREKWPNFNKKRAMLLVKDTTGNTKQGPRGPRRKLCG